jgi:dihydrofolate reductase
MTPPRSEPPRTVENSAAKTSVTPAASTAPEVALIAAVAANGVIGADNRLPWRLPDDLKRFRALTTGHAVIMGRKTWESLPHALPQRQNIVVTRQRGYVAAGAEVAHSFAEALALVRLPEPVFCIGGGELYRAALPLAATLHLTEIAREFEGDALFPPIDRHQWRETARENRPPAEPDGFAYSYVTYERERGAAASP